MPAALSTAVDSVVATLEAMLEPDNTLTELAASAFFFFSSSATWLPLSPSIKVNNLQEHQMGICMGRLIHLFMMVRSRTAVEWDRKRTRR